MLAWMSNCTVRSGAIRQRWGWNKLAVVSQANALYQGGWLYEQLNGNPYLMLSVGGKIIQVRVDTDNSVHVLSGAGTSNPANIPNAFFCQGEQFLVIQAGDLTPNSAGTLPLFWDGNTLRRSNGLTGNTSTSELPAATAMTYFQGHIWYAQGRIYSAGDTVGNTSSGTAPYNFTDSVLKVTESALAFGGDGFTVPTQAGNITALAYTAQLDTSLGQGNLYIFTRRQVNYLVVPINRTAWIAATVVGGSAQPQQGVALTRWGTTSDRSVVRVNGDLYFTTPLPAVQSLFAAIRYFNQWGNVPISRNVQRAMKNTNPILLGNASGVEFDNRMISGVLPSTTPVGIASQGYTVLDFDLISTLQEKLPPAWEGVYEGFNVLQFFEGDFGGQSRAFAVIYSQGRQTIEVWEMTTSMQNESGDNRVTWQFETPAYTFGKEFEWKELDGCEIWVDEVIGTVQLNVEYRVDSDVCWRPWLETQFCIARNQAEGIDELQSYPAQPNCPGFRFPINLPKPLPADPTPLQSNPPNVGYQFQLRITVKGWMRIRGILLYALPKDRTPFEGLVWSSTPTQPDGTKRD